MARVFINGTFVESDDARLSAFDAGLQHGVGLFDSLMGGARPDGEVWALHVDEHLARLVGSARALGLSESVREDGLRDAVLETIRRSGLARARVRVTVTGGDLNLLSQARQHGPESRATHAPTVLIAAQPATAYPADMFERGIAVTIADTRANPLNPMEGHKTLNYWWRLRDLAAAARKGAAEAVVLQVTNHLCGGCVSNVLVAKGGELWTPIARGEEAEAAEAAERQSVPASPAGKGAPLPSPVLPGIVRGWVLEEAARRGWPVKRRMLAVADLLDADEVFVTNSSWGVLPVVKVEREAIGDGVVGPIASGLSAAWNDQISRMGDA